MLRTRDGRGVIACGLGNVVEHHGLERHGVASDEELLLLEHDELHDLVEFFLAHLEQHDEISGILILPLDVHCFVAKAGAVGLVAGDVLVGYLVALRDLKFGDVVHHGEVELVVVGSDYKVGGDVRGVGKSLTAVEDVAWARIGALDDFVGLLECGLADVEQVDNLVVVVLLIGVEVLVNDLAGKSCRVDVHAFHVVDLQQDALPGAGGGNAGGLQVLYHLEHFLDLLRRDKDVLFRDDVATNRGNGTAQQAIVFYLANDILGNDELMLVEVALAHLGHEGLIHRRLTHHRWAVHVGVILAALGLDISQPVVVSVVIVFVGHRVGRLKGVLVAVAQFLTVFIVLALVFLVA